MSIKKIELENFTVFKKLDLDFSLGINVLIGENGTGKTHIMKVLYAACQAARFEKTAINFEQKIVRVFRPDNFELHRLVKRGAGNSYSQIKVSSEKNGITLKFDAKNRGNSEATGIENWKKQMADLECTFIPAKEILSNAKNLIQAIEKGNVEFDDTYKDLISSASVNVTPGPESEKTKKYLKELQKIMTGTVSIKDERFYLKPGSQSMLEFHLVAEGVRKIALLWQLIKNGTLEKGSILFWDEPEANINPKHIPALVDMLLKLQKDGVQIFIATHDYFLPKYLDVYKDKDNQILFHSLFLDQEKNINHESQSEFDLLTENSIITESINLYRQEVDKVMR